MIIVSEYSTSKEVSKDANSNSFQNEIYDNNTPRFTDNSEYNIQIISITA